MLVATNIGTTFQLRDKIATITIRDNGLPKLRVSVILVIVGFIGIVVFLVVCITTRQALQFNLTEWPLVPTSPNVSPQAHHDFFPFPLAKRPHFIVRPFLAQSRSFDHHIRASPSTILWIGPKLSSICNSLKVPKRREVCVPTFWRYLLFSVFRSKYLRREVCVSVFWRYLPFSVLGSKYLRSQRDERFACLRSGDMLHFLFWGCSLKVPKRREVCVSAFQRYITFSVLGQFLAIFYDLRQKPILFVSNELPAQAVAKQDQSARLGSALISARLWLEPAKSQSHGNTIPTRGVRAVNALLDFLYLAQYKTHDNITLGYMQDALDHFHDDRDYFIQVEI
ncbi:uncharacterized protein LACBIDRAFT_335427 [Laccaria bicolor S238N-H82]|uniref:Predicted protein n=1 Tax=Laccaria bicolor (strain S238N-H82 / ATCC MYA-4686) TaxID=486041 RepID=B0E2B0_LACBS|nr:uncharacterized protein LACBIDRAFT_335427 [Laccaria bicolor S238N-H82]EDQ99024.1 predicted protein [Laccaria bicolor S238N-H82]|eukprot:XP_001890332.1 predicted protein [Laccaria bicolor S238N-H82]